jgi:hypothetical protein
MKNDYEFLLRVINNQDNKLIHYPALKNLIDIWKNKWSDHKDTNVYSVYTYSLNVTLKRVFR